MYNQFNEKYNINQGYDKDASLMFLINYKMSIFYIAQILSHIRSQKIL